MEPLIQELKEKIIVTFNLEHMTPDKIDPEAPLFVEGLGLDSIDALELAVMLEKDYGIKLEDITVGRKVFQSIRTIAEYVTQKRG
ncbi:acyl carrier protein [bacterium]|nr:acyl carrier protein [bacterium]